MQAMKTQIQELIDKGWVVPSSSLWASPILLVPKDQGANLRLCVDFRDINALTKKDRFPFPCIERPSSSRIESSCVLEDRLSVWLPPDRSLSSYTEN